MAKRLFALTCAIVIGTLGCVVIACMPGCAWWQANEPLIGDISRAACMSAAAAACVDPAEAAVMCEMVHTAADLSRTMADRYCILDGGLGQ